MGTKSCCGWIKSLIAGAAALAAMASPALGVGNVVISQVWGGNSTNIALPAADYVELFNRGTTVQNLGGWSVSVSSATSTAWTKLDLPAFNLQPGQYFLVQVSAASAGGLALPTPDATFSPASTVLLTTSAKVALRNSTTAIGANLCITDATVVDLVTSSTSATATCFEGTGRAPTGSSTVPGLTPTRVLGGCTDTDNNNTDFVNAVPNPRNSSAPLNDCNAASGACCNLDTGACTLTIGAANCVGTYQGDNSVCPSVNCPPAFACCTGTTSTTCSVLTATGCANVGGILLSSTTCSPNPCAAQSCCFADGTCCSVSPALCASQGGTPGTAACGTTPGSCVPVPANDLCSAAQPLTLGTPRIGHNGTATGEDGLNTNCSATRVNKGVWYTFTPATTGTYDISSCETTFDNILGVWTIPNCADLSTWTAIACDDDGCPTGATSGSFCSTTGSGSAARIANVQLTAGVTYYVLLGADSTSATGGGNFTLLVTDTGAQPVGACCTTSTGVCWITTSTACTTVATPVGTYQGDGSVCSPSPCGGEVGACCVGAGVCVLRTAANCTGTSVFQGAGISCGPNPCITGSCCNTCTIACTVTLQENCSAATSVWTLDGVCTPNTCAGTTPPSNDQPAGAIVLALGSQVSGVNVNATDTNDGPLSTCDATVSRGTWYSFTPAATAFYQFATCGSTHDTVLTVFAASDLNTQIACDADTCVGGATDPSGCGTTTSSASAARIDFVELTAGTQYLIRVQSGGTTTFGTYVLVVNTTSVGACCSNSTGACTTTTPAGCGTTSTYQGDGTTCASNPCPPAGSCCTPCTFACTTSVQATCASGNIWTSGAVCSPNPCGGALPPGNDEPAGAIVLALGNQVVGVNVNATDTNDGPLSTCDTTVSRGTWYSFSPAATAFYQFATCGSTHDTVLTVFAASDLNTQIACDADTCAGGTTDPSGCGTTASSTTAARIDFVELTAGTQYLIRVQSGGTTTFGTYVLVVNTIGVGACCSNSTGACTTNTAAGCGTTSTYQGDGTTCASPCPPPGSCCNSCTFACTVTVQSNCASGSVWTLDGVCSPSPCGGAAPANDGPCGAIVLTAGSTVVANNASASSADDGPASTCGTAGNKGVWYSFTPATSGDYTITTCGATFDSLLAIFSGDCANPFGFIELACDDDACLGSTRDTVVCGTGIPSAAAGIITSVALVQGTTYYIRVSVDSATAIGGTFPISVRQLSTGSCCLATGGCSVVISELCANTNSYLPGAACGPTDCPPAGACCDPCGICAVTFANVCVGGATYQGDNTVCGVVVCPGDTTTPPANDNCVNATVISSFPYLASGCSSGATGDGPIGTCQAFGAPPSLLFSVWFKYTATQPGTLSVSVDFITWRGNRLALVFATTDGSCPINNTQQVVCGTTDPYPTTIEVTPGTTYFIAVADEGTITTDEGGSYVLTANFTGNNVVCCRGVTCAVIPAGDCTAPVGVGVRTVTGASCAGQSAINAGCCYADFNKSGIKDVADIFAFLSAWFANSPFSDVGGDGTGTRDVSDIFQFLSAWFAGCT